MKSSTIFFTLIACYLGLVIYLAVSVGGIINKVQQPADESQFRDCVEDLVNRQRFNTKQAMHECLMVYE